MAEYTPEQLGFIDETSKDDCVPGRRRGRAKKGRRAKRKQVFVRGHRLSGTGLLSVNGMVASTVVEGSMTGRSFLEFLHDDVVRTRESEISGSIHTNKLNPCRFPFVRHFLAHSACS